MTIVSKSSRLFFKCLSEIQSRETGELFFHSAKRYLCSSKILTAQGEKFRKFFENAGIQLGVEKWQDWYNFRRKDFCGIEGGEKILRDNFNGSLVLALSEVFPEYGWQPWKFYGTPVGFWKEISNQRIFFDSLGKELAVKKLEDWYNISLTIKDLETHKATGLSSYYSSPTRALMNVYPEFNWKIWKFGNAPQQTIWDDQHIHRDFMDEFAKEREFKHWTDWYQVKRHEIEAAKGLSLLHRHYEGSVSQAVMKIYPEHPWRVSKFAETIQHREFFDNLGKKLHIKRWEDWYGVKHSEITDNGGHSIISHYGNSFIKALMTVYHEYPWRIWKFNRVPNGFWDEKSTRIMIEQLSSELGIRQLDDWWGVTTTKLDAVGFPFGVADKHGGFINLLTKLYPDHNWESKPIIESKSQNSLFAILKDLFPHVDLHFNYPHPDLQYRDSKKLMELDVYIPSFKVAFEYQGRQHYEKDDMYMYADNDLKERDIEKKQACSEAGIKLIEVPYWWDLSTNSLVEIIRKHRPDLVQIFKENYSSTTSHPYSVSLIEPQKWPSKIS